MIDLNWLFSNNIDKKNNNVVPDREHHRENKNTHWLAYSINISEI